jgi:hypothetical protein
MAQPVKAAKLVKAPQPVNPSSHREDSLGFGQADLGPTPGYSERFLKMQLNEPFLFLHENSIACNLKHVDYFVSQSRGNTCVRVLNLRPSAFNFNGHDDNVWEKLGQAIGNLQGVDMLRIATPRYHDGDEVPRPAWERLARILSHLRREIALADDFEGRSAAVWRAGDVRSFARVIRGHPTISSFEGGCRFPYESSDVLYSALATLPALASISLSNSGHHTKLEDESALTNPESLTELLRVPSLWSVCFDKFSFTPALCRAMANALMKGTTSARQELEFKDCSFPAEECAKIFASGLARNTSVISIVAQRNNARALFDALAAALPLNSTLEHLEWGRENNNDGPDLCPHLPQLFSALRQNKGLKALEVALPCSMDESLCTAMHNGLGMNGTLESLELNRTLLCDDTANLWRRAISFLNTNKTLKSLSIEFKDVTKSCISGFCTDTAAMLQENTSLESLCITSHHCRNPFQIKAEEYIAFVTALQHNTALKTLSLYHNGKCLRLNDDERKQMTSLLKKNYALEILPNILLGGDMGAILRLNGAGRRYLIEDRSSISKGIEVLSAVSKEINCIFLHLLENPKLCDRSAMEMVAAGESNGRSTNPNASSGRGKREQASAHGGKESRRRLA